MKSNTTMERCGSNILYTVYTNVIRVYLSYIYVCIYVLYVNSLAGRLFVCVLIVRNMNDGSMRCNASYAHIYVCVCLVSYVVYYLFFFVGRCYFFTSPIDDGTRSPHTICNDCCNSCNAISNCKQNSISIRIKMFYFRTICTEHTIQMPRQQPKIKLEYSCCVITYNFF